MNKNYNKLKSFEVSPRMVWVTPLTQAENEPVFSSCGPYCEWMSLEKARIIAIKGMIN